MPPRVKPFVVKLMPNAFESGLELDDVGRPRMVYSCLATLRGPVAAAVGKPFAEINGRVRQWRDAPLSNQIVEEFGLVSPTAEVAIGEFKKQRAAEIAKNRRNV